LGFANILLTHCDRSGLHQGIQPGYRRFLNPWE